MHRHKPINQKNIAVKANKEYETIEYHCACTNVGCQTVDPNDNTQKPISFSCKANSSEFHIIYIIDGQGIYSSDSEGELEIKKGNVFLIRPGQNYTFSADKSTGWTMYWISFMGDNVKRYIENIEVFNEIKPLAMGVNATLEGIINGMIMVSIDKKKGSHHLLMASVFNVLALINFKVLNYNERENPVIGRIHEAREILRNDIKAQISPETVAERVGISYSLFRRIFKGYMGVSPVQFQMDVRHKRAEELLSTTNYSIAEIAEILGFSDTAQFSTFFHKRQGITARDYRKMYK